MPSAVVGLGLGLPPQAHARPRRNAKQLRNPPDNVLFKFIQRSVGIGHVPKHRDDLQAPVFVERALQNAGEAKEIDGIAFAFRRMCD